MGAGEDEDNMVRELSEEQKMEIKEAFELFDTDKDGAIDCKFLGWSWSSESCSSSSLALSLVAPHLFLLGISSRSFTGNRNAS